MIFQIPIDRDCVFHWYPAGLPDPAATAPDLVINAGSQSHTVPLVKDGTVTINSITDRYRLKATASSAATLGGLVGSRNGYWWLYLKGHGQFAVTVSHFDDEQKEYVLSEPLPHGIPSGAAGSLIHNAWRATIPAGALGAQVDRAGYYEIHWSQDYDLNGNNIQGREFSERGRVRVVKNTFETGLTSRRLKTLVPQLEGTRPPNRDGWQELIDMVDILGAVESRLPGANFADQTLAEQWRRAHALLVAAHIAEVGYAPNVDAERMRELADQELDRQARKIHWFDKDDDDAIDADETGVVYGMNTKITVSSAADTVQSFTDGKRYRPLLDDKNDR
tara:strand:+ start:351 stop:1352 length:1002 start_codon:yes stop_codon:yes gene_type:complete